MASLLKRKLNQHAPRLVNQQPSTKGPDRFICPSPGCHKEYLDPRSLKFHAKVAHPQTDGAPRPQDDQDDMVEYRRQAVKKSVAKYRKINKCFIEKLKEIQKEQYAP